MGGNGLCARCEPRTGEFRLQGVFGTSFPCAKEVTFGEFSLARQRLPLSLWSSLASFGFPFPAKRNGDVGFVKF